MPQTDSKPFPIMSRNQGMEFCPGNAYHFRDDPESGMGFHLAAYSDSPPSALKTQLRLVAGLRSGGNLTSEAWRACLVDDRFWTLISYVPLKELRAGSLSSVLHVIPIDELPAWPVDPTASLLEFRKEHGSSCKSAQLPEVKLRCLDRAEFLDQNADAIRPLAKIILAAATGTHVVLPPRQVSFVFRAAAALLPLRTLIRLDLVSAEPLPLLGTPPMGTIWMSADRKLTTDEEMQVEGQELYLELLEQAPRLLASALDQVDDKKDAPASDQLPFLVLGLALSARPGLHLERTDSADALAHLLRAEGIHPELHDQAVRGCLLDSARVSLEGGADQFCDLIVRHMASHMFQRAVQSSVRGLQTVFEEYAAELTPTSGAAYELLALYDRLRPIMKDLEGLSGIWKALLLRLDQQRPAGQGARFMDWMRIAVSEGQEMPELAAHLEAECWRTRHKRIWQLVEKLRPQENNNAEARREHSLRVVNKLVNSSTPGGLSAMIMKDQDLRDPNIWMQRAEQLNATASIGTVGKLVQRMKTKWFKNNPELIEELARSVHENLSNPQPSAAWPLSKGVISKLAWHGEDGMNTTFSFLKVLSRTALRQPTESTSQHLELVLTHVAGIAEDAMSNKPSAWRRVCLRVGSALGWVVTGFLIAATLAWADLLPLPAGTAQESGSDKKGQQVGKTDAAGENQDIKDGQEAGPGQEGAATGGTPPADDPSTGADPKRTEDNPTKDQGAADTKAQAGEGTGPSVDG